MMGSRRLVARLILGSAAAFVSLSPARADGIAVEPVTFPAPFYEATGSGEPAYRLDNVLEASGFSRSATAGCCWWRTTRKCRSA